MSPSLAASPPVATRPSGPVRPGDRARIRLRPAGGARITGGFWRERRRASVETSIPHGPPLLESAGNLHDLRSAAGTADGAYRGVLPFLDSDVTKWLEDSSWQLADPDTPDRTTLSRAVDVMIRLLTEAQQDDDCLQTWYQVTKPGPGSPSRSGAMSCTAPVISSRPPSPTAAPPDAEDLLTVARHFADHDGIFGSGKPAGGICGHPEIDIALVELYRETGERRYPDLAEYFIERRGHGLLGEDVPPRPRPGPNYCQDRVPMREAETVTGHVVCDALRRPLRAPTRARPGGLMALPLGGGRRAGRGPDTARHTGPERGSHPRRTDRHPLLRLGQPPPGQHEPLVPTC